MRLPGQFEYDTNFANLIYEELRLALSDKGVVHQYHPIYAYLLSQVNVKKMLSVGLFLNYLPNTDLTAWSKIFPTASICGADIKKDLLFNRDNIRMCYVDQNNKDSLNALKDEFGKDFDVVIDDASHKYSSTIRTFEALFPAVANGGIYIIEDCLSDNEHNNGWQQTVSSLSVYLTEKGHRFEVFQSRMPNKLRDFSTGLLTEHSAPSDDFIICVFN